MLNTVILGVALGLVAPLAVPGLLKRTKYSTAVGNSYFGMVSKALKRPAIGVGKHGDLELRQLSFDAVYDQETVEVGDVEKKITRTARNVHRVGHTPFTFVDEVFGVTFDLRDVLLGEQAYRHADDGKMVCTDMEFRNGEPTRLDHYVRGFFEVSERKALRMDLDESVRPITDGSEKADWWDYMWETVRRMYIKRQREVGVIKMLIPFIVAAGGLALGFYLLGPGQMPGSPSGMSDPITVGSLLLWSAPRPRQRLAELAEKVRDRLGSPSEPAGDREVNVPWKHIGIGIGALATVGLFVGGVLLAGVVTSIVFLVAFAVGAALLPLLMFLFGGLGYGASLGDLHLWAGLQAFDEPVLELTDDDRYRFEEADVLGLDHVPKAKLAKTLVGFSPEVSPEAFGHAGLSSSQLVDYLPGEALVADGGSGVLPQGFVPSDRITNAGHQAFVPKSSQIDDRATYVRTDNWLSRFGDAATGDAIDKAEREATKEFAAGDPKFSDEQLMKYSAIAAVCGFGFWVVIAVAF